MFVVCTVYSVFFFFSFSFFYYIIFLLLLALVRSSLFDFNIQLFNSGFRSERLLFFFSLRKHCFNGFLVFFRFFFVFFFLSCRIMTIDYCLCRCETKENINKLDNPFAIADVQFYWPHRNFFSCFSFIENWNYALDSKKMYARNPLMIDKQFFFCPNTFFAFNFYIWTITYYGIEQSVKKN